ncbi:hypothetical protein C7E17_26180, partial [Stenotrophomonas maltophilia]
QCGQPLQMPQAGGRSMAVDIEQYARTFPDSYFDPQRSSVPRDPAPRRRDAVRPAAADAAGRWAQHGGGHRTVRAHVP